MLRRLRVLLCAAACGLGCAPDEVDDDVSTDDGWDVARTCTPPPGLGAPQHIADVVALVNALPMPVTLPCLLEALERPLAVAGIVSPFSAQATTQQDRPRLFVFSGDLVLAVVTTGEARSLLELGEYVEQGRTLKGEIEFPVEAPLPDAAPFEHILFGGSSTCALCHDHERYAGKVGDVSTYTSEALAPETDRILPIGLVEQHARDCRSTFDPATEPDGAESCAMLESIFAHGDVVAGKFDGSTRICVTP